MTRRLRITLLLVGLIVPQVVLIGPALVGRKILLSLDILKLPGVYQPASSFDPRQAGEINPSLGDIVVEFEPNRVYAVREIRAGRLPLWNPNNYCGAPFMAANQPAVFAPLRIIDYLI